MTPLAYYLFGLSGVLGALINFCAFVIFILLVFWILDLLGVAIPQNIRTAIIVLGLLICLAMCFAGCSTNTGNAKKDARGRVTNAVLSEVFNSVLQAGLQYGAQSLAGTNGQDAAKGIFENVAVINGPQDIEHIMQAYAGPEVAPIAKVASSQLAKINPQTDAERVLILNTIGAAVQQVSNQKFAQ